MTTWYLAIDFGTTSTCAATVTDAGTAQLVHLGADGNTRMPSGALLLPDGSLAVGFEAERLAGAFPDCYEAAPKRNVGRATVLLGDTVVPVVELVAAVLSEVLRQAREQRGGVPPTRACLTVPARWSAHRRAVLLDAATRAGLGDVALLTEPEAAAYHYSLNETLAVGDTVAVYDLGGGTFDTALLRRTPDGFTFAGSPGGIDPFGGDDVDQRLAAALLHRVGHEPGALVLARPATAADQQVGHAFRRDVRRAKEALTRQETAELVLAGSATLVTVSRDDVRAVARADVDATVTELARTTGTAGVDLASVTAIYLAGSASRMPLVREALERALGPRADSLVRTLDDPKLACALGAARYLHDADNSPAQPAPIRLGVSQRRKRTPLQAFAVALVAVVALTGYILFQLHHHQVDELHGTVRDSRGQPMADTEITIQPGLDKHTVHTKTDDHGHYEAKLPNGSYQLEAKARVSYRGADYELDLTPHHQGDEVVDIPHSASSSLDWDLAIEGDDQSESVNFWNWMNDEGSGPIDLFTIAQQGDFLIELTFTPRGALIDGSKGRTIVRQVPISFFVDGGAYPSLSGLPIGTYTLTAELIDGSTTYPLVLGYSDDPAPSRRSVTLPLDQELTTPIITLGYTG